MSLIQLKEFVKDGSNFFYYKLKKCYSCWNPVLNIKLISVHCSQFYVTNVVVCSVDRSPLRTIVTDTETYSNLEDIIVDNSKWKLDVITCEKLSGTRPEIPYLVREICTYVYDTCLRLIIGVAPIKLIDDPVYVLEKGRLSPRVVIEIEFCRRKHINVDRSDIKVDEQKEAGLITRKEIVDALLVAFDVPDFDLANQLFF